MVKELGSEHAKFLLHSHDRLIDETVQAIGPTGAAVSNVPTMMVSRNNRSLSNIASHLSDDGMGEKVLFFNNFKKFKIIFINFSTIMKISTLIK